MRTLFVLTGLLLQVSAQAPLDPAGELRALTEQRLRARNANDRSFYERLLADNFQILDARQPALTKQAYLDAEFGTPVAGRAGEPQVTNFRALVMGETAVVSYQAVQRTLLGSTAFDDHSMRLDTYARVGGSWRLLSMAAAEPPSWPDVAAVDPSVLREYAGTYVMPGGIRIVVTSKDGHLTAAVGEQPGVELFPESATSFFDKTDSPFARTIFERDRSGKVVAQTYRSQGQRVRAPRIAP